MSDKAATNHHKLRLDGNGELDEIYITDATVHIERMDDSAFWIGIDSPGLPRLHINTGVQRGVWFFRAYEDILDAPQTVSVQRPRSAKRINRADAERKGK